VIWLVRHTEAEDGSPDADRELTAKGEEDARTIAAALSRLGVQADGCVSSPKVRARETARPICERLGHGLTEDDRLAGGPFDAQEVAGEVGEDAILVGHDPDLSMAVHRMTGAQVRLPKGAVVGVDRGELKVLLRLEELRVLCQEG
jgi:phosphohistidine phosphatase SixA